MKAIILCEGPDDLWFIAYYLHKRAGWDTRNSSEGLWRNYKAKPLNSRQQVQYLRRGNDSVVVWSVGGKDSFSLVLSAIFKKFIQNYPFDPISSIVIVRDRDNDSIAEALREMQTWFPDGVELSNCRSTVWESETYGCRTTVNITPVLIPFNETGAIETLLIESIKEHGEEERAIVQEAGEYIRRLVSGGKSGLKYLSHQRLILKAKYSAVIAVTNPEHSTCLFQDMVMACPWEKSPYVREHFDVILSAISSDNTRADPL